MRKKIAAFVVIFAVIFSFSSAFAANDNTVLQWEVVKSGSKLFPRIYVLGHCVVKPRSDGLGAVLMVEDYNVGNLDYVVQRIFIEKGKEAPYKEQAALNDGQFFLFLWKRDIFAEKCLDLAKLLPAKVRLTFWGHYGM